MESDNNNPDFADQKRQPRWLPTAMAVSLLFHLIIVLAIVQARFATTPSPVAVASKPVIMISLRRPAPMRVAPDGSQTLPGTAVDSPPPAPEPARDLPAAEQLPPPLRTEADTSVAITPTAQDVPATDADTKPGTAGALDTERLTSSIRQYIKTYTEEQQAEWFEECQLIRNRYFTQDCTLDPSTRSGSRAIPMSTIEPLLDDDSMLGELARERYALIAEPRNFHLIKTREERLLDPTIRLLTIGPDGLGGGLVNNWVTRGVLSALGVVTDPIAAPSFVEPADPLPVNTAEEQDDDRLTRFDKTPPLFPGSD
jgi:hypothetical protein